MTSRLLSMAYVLVQCLTLVACGNWSDKHLDLACEPDNLQTQLCPCGRGERSRTCTDDQRWGDWQGACECARYEACNGDGDCAAGLLCAGGRCLEGCAVGSRCSEPGALCVDNVCRTQELPCIQAGLTCPLHASCVVGEAGPACVCKPYFFGVTCDGCTVFVNGSGQPGPADGLAFATAFTDLQAGIDMAASAIEGSTDTCDVLVGAGIYFQYRGAASDTLMLRAGVHVSGGYVAAEPTVRSPELFPTILDGRRTPAEDLRVYHVVTGADRAALDGLQIRFGAAHGPTRVQQQGAGLLNLGVNGVRLTNCTFRDNNAASDGGAVYNEDSAVVIETCVFDGNSAAHGGAIYNNDSTIDVTGTSFIGNSALDGGAMYNDDSTVNIGACTFDGNEAENGGALFNILSSPVISNTSFASNLATENGGAICNFSSTPVLSNCSFDKNYATLSGDSIFTYVFPLPHFMFR